MFSKSDGINCYCYQRSGELCQGKVMGWGWAFQWDPLYVNLDSFGFEFCGKIWVFLLWLWLGLKEEEELERRD